MSTTAVKNPISDLMFNWLTVLQNKAEGVAAYERYIEDAEAAQATECAEMFKRLHEQDVRALEEIKDHVFHLIAHSPAPADHGVIVAEGDLPKRE